MKSIFQTVYRQCLSDNNKTTEYQNITPSMECQQPWGMVPESVFPNLWRIIYWTSQFLTWLIMPLMQSYLKAGDFTIKGKLKASIIDNGKLPTADVFWTNTWNSDSFSDLLRFLLVYLRNSSGIFGFEA